MESIREFYISTFPSPSTGGLLVLSPAPGIDNQPGDLSMDQITIRIPALNAQSCSRFWGISASCHRFLVIVRKK